MSIKKYLVTGGSGFIGSALVKRLVREGNQVRVLDNNSRGNVRRLTDVIDQIDFIEGDIRDIKVVLKACEGMDSVCHLAYINGTEFFYTKPELILEVGVKGMMNVIDACIEHHIDELILASSSEVYQHAKIIPTDETTALTVPDPLNPRYSYGGGKIISELLALNYGRKHFKKVIVFRPHNVFGPDMGWEHVIPQFILKAKSIVDKSPGETIVSFPIQGNGEETRSFIYIDDFTDGLMLLLKNGEHNNIYHIGTVDELTIKEVALEVGKYFGVDFNVIPGELPKGATTRRCPDIAKLKALGFEPLISLAEGIKRSADWYVNHLDLQPAKEISK
jgi:nucleoside-diphosphate-sugar epimerase